MEIQFKVPGLPRGKGRPRFSRSGHPYTDEKTRDYETYIVHCYRAAHGALRFPDTAFLSVHTTAYFLIPKSASRAQRADMESGRILPARKPDVDNIEKVVLDALNGIAYKDDARVCQTGCGKYYGREPGLVITIREV